MLFVPKKFTTAPLSVSASLSISLFHTHTLYCFLYILTFTCKRALQIFQLTCQCFYACSLKYFFIQERLYLSWYAIFPILTQLLFSWVYYTKLLRLIYKEVITFFFQYLLIAIIIQINKRMIYGNLLQISTTAHFT